MSTLTWAELESKKLNAIIDQLYERTIGIKGDIRGTYKKVASSLNNNIITYNIMSVADTDWFKQAVQA